MKTYGKCPHCSILAEFQWQHDGCYVVIEGDDPEDPVFSGVAVSHAQCPSCQRVIVVLKEGEPHGGEGSGIPFPRKEQRIYPLASTRTMDVAIPPAYRDDLLEACNVENLSPKASAALSRRLLQRLLRNEHAIAPANLAQEIEEFIQKRGVPSPLTEAVDAIRNIGNFAAHPLKSTHSGVIVDVEPGEASWLLEVLEAMLDYTFVQPARLAERKDRLNKKLQELGKLPMKAP